MSLKYITVISRMSLVVVLIPLRTTATCSSWLLRILPLLIWLHLARLWLTILLLLLEGRWILHGVVGHLLWVSHLRHCVVLRMELLLLELRWILLLWIKLLRLVLHSDSICSILTLTLLRVLCTYRVGLVVATRHELIVWMTTHLHCLRLLLIWLISHLH